MNVVFTGPAFNTAGASIVRADLTYACIQRGGIVVQPRVDAATDLLVASRIDTVKATATFLLGVTIPKNGTANRYVDAFRAVAAICAPAQDVLVCMDAL
jgi:hypothetical protein